MDLSAAIERTNFEQRPRVDAAAGALVGSECRGCGARSWPGRAICNRCGSADVGDVALESEGSLLTITTVWISRPRLEAPYVLGNVELLDGVRVYAHVRGLDTEAALPCRVRVAIPPDDDALPRFWFEPV